MAENLRYEVPIDTAKSIEIYCPQDPDSLAVIGCYYTGKAVANACPAGWKLPVFDDYINLMRQFSSTYPWGILETVCNTNALPSTTYMGNDVYGFNVVRTGWYDKFSGIIQGPASAFYWTNSFPDIFGADFRGISRFDFDADTHSASSYMANIQFAPARCLKR
jgi:uncharacterized protein (TIGR02145 family)